QAALDACTGLAEGALCSADRIDGSCQGGACIPSTCGDGVTTGREQCDGSTPLTCEDFLFYTGTVTCSDSCLYDTSGCMYRCGDHLLQSVYEDCDGSAPTYKCTDRGYDYGHLTCTDRCRDSSATDCGVLSAREIFDGSARVTDLYQVGN